MGSSARPLSLSFIAAPVVRWTLAMMTAAALAAGAAVLIWGPDPYRAPPSPTLMAPLFLGPLAGALQAWVLRSLHTLTASRATGWFALTVVGGLLTLPVGLAAGFATFLVLSAVPVGSLTTGASVGVTWAVLFWLPIFAVAGLAAGLTVAVLQGWALRRWHVLPPGWLRAGAIGGALFVLSYSGALAVSRPANGTALVACFAAGAAVYGAVTGASLTRGGPQALTSPQP